MNQHGIEPYLHVGRASDLAGRDRALYRAFEILPGLLSFGTLIAFIPLSLYRPSWAAYLTIVFSMYWLLKTSYLSMHLRHNFRRIRHNMRVDWHARLASVRYDRYVHLVAFPFYDEPYEVLKESVEAIARARWDTKNIIVLLAAEERSPEGEAVARRLAKEYEEVFMDVLVSVHPAGLPGDIPGKGSNLSFAAEEARVRVLDPRGLSYEHVIVSAFDSDTVVYPDYFACLTWHVCTSTDPLRSSFQPVPLYNNNIWHVPMLARVIAYSSSFWQMTQQQDESKHMFITPVYDVWLLPTHIPRRHNAEENRLEYKAKTTESSDRVWDAEPAYGKGRGDAVIPLERFLNGRVAPRDHELDLCPRTRERLAGFRYLNTMRLLGRHPRIREIDDLHTDGARFNARKWKVRKYHGRTR
jgi:hypothetical protein